MTWLGQRPLPWDKSRKYRGVQVFVRPHTQRRGCIPSSSLLRSPCGVPWASDFGRGARDDDEDVRYLASFLFLITSIPSLLSHAPTPGIPVPITSIDTAHQARLIHGVIGAVAAIVTPGTIIPVTAAIVIGIAPSFITTASTACPDIIVTAAMGILPHPTYWGWLACMMPVPPAASSGRGPSVAVARGGGVVVPPVTSVGVDGSGDEHSAAPTTKPFDAVTAVPIHPSTTSPLITSLIHDTSDAPVVHDCNTPALLPMTMLTSHTNSTRGRDHASEGLQGARQLVGHPPPPPTVVVDRAAQHGGGRPTASANAALATMLPRPGPASLLPPSLRPQQGRRRQRGGRVGGVPRAAGITGDEATGSDAAHPVAVALAVSPAAMRAVG